MMLLMSRQEALRQLTGVYRMEQAVAVRALAIADQLGVTAQTTPSRKPVTIRAKHNGKEQYEVDDGIPVEAVGKVTGTGYNRRKQGDDKTPTEKEAAMAGKGRTAPAEVEQNGEADYTVYATKEITDTMVDFHQWLEQEVGIKLDLRSVALGGTLRMEFQKSDFNRNNREARRAQREQEAEAAKAEREAAKAERAAAKAEAASQAEEPKPAPRGRKPASTAKATGGTTGPRAAGTGRGRGRPKATAAAPF